MDRKQLIRECLVITCFLENIDTNDKKRMDKLIKGLNEYSTDKLKEYYDVNLKLKEIRINRILAFKKENMKCDLCNKELHPLDAHMGKLNDELITAHIDCWNKEIKG